MLTSEMTKLIRNHTAGMVASINADGTPAVSPKATFVVVDDATIAYGDIRSPGTRANVARNANVEVCFIDVVTRKAVRATGTARLVPKSDAGPALKSAFDDVWSEYLSVMTAFVEIKLSSAELILSPGYDVGYSEAELREANLKRLNAL